MHPLLMWAPLAPTLALAYAGTIKLPRQITPQLTYASKAAAAAAVGGLLTQTPMGTRLGGIILEPVTGYRHLEGLAGHTAWIIALGYLLAYALQRRGAIDTFSKHVVVGCATSISALWIVFFVGGIGYRPPGNLLFLRGIVTDAYWLILLGATGALLVLTAYHLRVVATYLEKERDIAQLYSVASIFILLLHLTCILTRVSPDVLGDHRPLFSITFYTLSTWLIAVAAVRGYNRLVRPLAIPSHWPPMGSRAEMTGER